MSENLNVDDLFEIQRRLEKIPKGTDVFLMMDSTFNELKTCVSNKSPLSPKLYLAPMTPLSGVPIEVFHSRAEMRIRSILLRREGKVVTIVADPDDES